MIIKASIVIKDNQESERHKRSCYETIERMCLNESHAFAII